MRGFPTTIGFRSAAVLCALSIVAHVLMRAVVRRAPASSGAHFGAGSELLGGRPRWVSGDELLGARPTVRSKLQPRVRCWADASKVRGGRTSRRAIVSSFTHRNCGERTYAQALRVLGYSLRLHLADPDVVRLLMVDGFEFGETALDDDVCLRALHGMGWIPCVAHPIRPEEAPKDERYRGRFTKLALFNMLVFERVLYIDADVLVRQSFDGVFDAAPLSASAPLAAVRQWRDGEWSDTFDGSLLLIRPNASLFTDMYQTLMHRADKERWVQYDVETSFQGFLAAYLKSRALQWSELPWTVAASDEMFAQAPVLWRAKESEIRAVHFAGPLKPFLVAKGAPPPREVAPLFAWYEACTQDMIATAAQGGGFGLGASARLAPRPPAPPPALKLNYLAPGHEALLARGMHGGTTIVTSFYHLAANKHASGSYHDWMMNMLTLRDPLVIFTDAATWKEIGATVREARAQMLSQTATVFMPIAETRFARKYGIARFAHQQRWRAPLLMLWMAKTEFLGRIAELNPFKSHDFFWVDIGSYRDGSKKGCDHRTDKYCYTGRELVDASVRKTLSPTRLLIAIRGHAMTGALFGGTRRCVISFTVDILCAILLTQHLTCCCSP